MFEPKTYEGKQSVVLRELLLEVIRSLPPQSIEAVKQSYFGAMNALEQLKIVHANEVLGPVTIEGEERAVLKYARDLLAANVGRTFFNSKIKGATFDGAIGTKSFGQKWRAWVNQLPQLFDLVNPDATSCFVQDTSFVRSRHEVGAVSLLVRIRNQIIVFTPNGPALSAFNIYVDQVPENFNWQLFQTELFSYRADVTRGELAVALANAVIAQGVTTFAVPADGSEGVMAALTAAGLDKVLTIIVEDAEDNASAPINDNEAAKLHGEHLKEVSADAAVEIHAQAAEYHDIMSARPVAGADPEIVTLRLHRDERLEVRLLDGKDTSFLAWEIPQGAQRIVRDAANAIAEVLAIVHIEPVTAEQAAEVVVDEIVEIDHAANDTGEVAQLVDAAADESEPAGEFEELVETAGEIVRFETEGGVKTYSPNDFVVVTVNGSPNNVTARKAVELFRWRDESATVELVVADEDRFVITLAEVIVPGDAVPSEPA